ncbi:hypothetical protein AVEN_71467-1 [Araneus ventricosus]|uniref:Uncharacterized protein n=1 Tax=Araneus ventricosus TaxID=182803 RepID=A0A4Y2CV88_ARAVE|nr:hypothetical protein AVEN_71467-1 [Araneus ventricosus]
MDWSTDECQVVSTKSNHSSVSDTASFPINCRPRWLVARSQPRDRRIAGSKPIPLKDPPCMGPVTLNHISSGKRPPAGVAWKFGEGCQLRCRPRHLTAFKDVRPK